MLFRYICPIYARYLSTSAVSGQMVKPPVAVFGTEGRYATALFSAASKQKALDAVEKDLKAFQTQLDKDTRLKEFLFDPSVKKGVKADGLASACDKMKVAVKLKHLKLNTNEVLFSDESLVKEFVFVDGRKRPL